MYPNFYLTIAILHLFTRSSLSSSLIQCLKTLVVKIKELGANAWTLFHYPICLECFKHESEKH